MPDSDRSIEKTATVAAGVVIGVDFGTKRIGLAIGQRVTGTAVPLCTIRVGNVGEPWKTISETVVTWRPALFVVGLSRHPEGRDNPVTEETRRFCGHLQKRYRLPVVTIDETLSTADSRRRYFAEPRGSKLAFSDVKDEWAAQVILQTWLDESNV